MSKFFGAGASTGEFFQPQQRPTVCCEERRVMVWANLAPAEGGEVENIVFYQRLSVIECNCHNGEECPPDKEGPLVRDATNTNFNWSETKYKFCCNGCSTEEPEPEEVVVGDILGERRGPCSCEGWAIWPVGDHRFEDFVSVDEVKEMMIDMAHVAFDELDKLHPDSICIGCDEGGSDPP